MKMKSLLILFFVIFNCLFISAYGDEEIIDYDDLYKELLETGDYFRIFECFCISRDLGVLTCYEICDGSPLCNDLIDYRMDRKECPFDDSLTLKEKCDLIESIILKKGMLKSKLSERQLLILIHKLKKYLHCPVTK